MARHKKKPWCPELSPIGYEVINCYKRHMLLIGPRFCCKSSDAAHRICRHAIETKGHPLVAIVGDTLGNLKSAGVWNSLTQWAIPMWIDAGLTEWIKTPRTTADTKMTYCIIRTVWGGQCEIQVHSLNYEDDVELKFKSAEFSLIYMPEADQFKKRKTYSVLSACLRRSKYGVPEGDHHMLLDCNPPEEGEDHWIEDEFFRMRNAKGEPMSAEHCSHRKVFQYTLANNVFSPAEKVQEIIDMYAYDSLLYARFVLGKRVKATRKGHFSDVLLPNIHFVGNCRSPNKAEWEYIIPPPDCFEMFTGWDMGDVFHVCVFVAPRRPKGELTAYDVIGEVVYLAEPISIAAFTQEVMQEMAFWERTVHETSGTTVRWRHISDPSAFRYRSGGSGGTDEMTAEAASNGKIRLIGADKERGSVGDGVRLIKRLLYEKRLFVSARCSYMQSVLRNLKPGPNWRPGRVTELIQYGDEKHGFDALHYVLTKVEMREISNRVDPVTKKGLVMVPA